MFRISNELKTEKAGNTRKRRANDDDQDKDGSKKKKPVRLSNADVGEFIVSSQISTADELEALALSRYQDGEKVLFLKKPTFLSFA